MAYENIEFAGQTFCIGPQSGTYCYVDFLDLNNVVLKVKNNSGDLIRNYAFLPLDIFYTDLDNYPYHTIVDLKYIGPKGQDSFYTGAVFYTLERVYVGNFKSPDDTTVDYSDRCIVRKWLLNNESFTLSLTNTFYINSDSYNYFDSYTFSVENQTLNFASSTPKHTEEIEVNSAANLSTGDVLMLGPSSDADNTGDVEQVYIHAIDGNLLDIRSFDGVTPTRYEYVVGDPVTYIGDIYIFSNPRPILVNTGGYLYFEGYADNGFLYKLDQNNYCTVLDKDENAKYTNINASVWNISTGGLSFVKVNNYITVDVNDNYENIKSQVIKTITTNFEQLQVYSLDYIGNDLYFLQGKVIKINDTGSESVISWQTYNYVKDSIIPYNYSTNIITGRSILTKYTAIIVGITVRDQFNNGVLGSNVKFTFLNDNNATLDPPSGDLVTDVDGFCDITFTSGFQYTGQVEFNARSDKGNTSQGSAYTNCVHYVSVNSIYQAYHSIVQIPEEIEFYQHLTQLDLFKSELNVTCKGLYVAGIGGDSEYTNVEDVEPGYGVPLLVQIMEPTSFSESWQGGPLYSVHVDIVQFKYSSGYHISTVSAKTDDYQVSQVKASRHIEDLNKDSMTVNQFVFIKDAIPYFYEEKVTVNTSIWIRLRPFSYSLDPDTLTFKIREVNASLEYDSGIMDVTNLGETSLFDAGGGMFGVDFLYQPGYLFRNESIVYVYIHIKDKAPVPNYLEFDYWFKIISDYKGPEVFNISPTKNSIGVKINTPIEFYITDIGIGLDISGITLFINDSTAQYSYTLIEPNTYKITYYTDNKFNYGDDVSVNVVAVDKSKYENTTYTFWTITFENSTGPLVDMSNSIPKMCTEGIDNTVTELSFQVYAINGTGVDYYTVSTSINTKEYSDSMSLLPIIYHKR